MHNIDDDDMLKILEKSGNLKQLEKSGNIQKISIQAVRVLKYIPAVKNFWVEV